MKEVKKMNFTCNKIDLENALSYASRASNSKAIVSIQECVLLTADKKDGITLVGTDNQISIDTKPFFTDVEEEGSIALNARLFMDIVKKLPGNRIHVKVDAKLNAILTSGHSVLKMAGLNAHDFPLVVEEELVCHKKYKIKANSLKDMVRQTIFSVSTDPSKPILTGELMEIKENELRVIAIDMFRISYRAEKFTEPAEDSKAVVPSKALGELSRMVNAESDGDVEFFFTDKKAVFLTEDFRLVASLHHGDYIRYDQIFNEDFSTKLKVNRELFLHSCERVMLIASDGKPISMKLEISENDLLVSALSERGEVRDNINCETEGKEMVIYFNARYFIDVLRVVEVEEVTLKFNSIMSPCTISIEEAHDNFKYLIVPLRPPQ